MSINQKSINKAFALGVLGLYAFGFGLTFGNKTKDYVRVIGDYRTFIQRTVRNDLYHSNVYDIDVYRAYSLNANLDFNANNNNYVFYYANGEGVNYVYSEAYTNDSDVKSKLLTQYTFAIRFYATTVESSAEVEYRVLNYIFYWNMSPFPMSISGATQYFVPNNIEYSCQLKTYNNDDTYTNNHYWYFDNVDTYAKSQFAIPVAYDAWALQTYTAPIPFNALDNFANGGAYSCCFVMPIDDYRDIWVDGHLTFNINAFYVSQEMLQQSAVNTAYNNGYSDGYDDGKNYVLNNPNEFNLYDYANYLTYGQSKYNEGLADGANVLSLSGVMNTIFTAPINMFMQIFRSGAFVWTMPTGEVLDLGGLMTFFLTIGIALAIVRLIMKVGGK